MGLILIHQGRCIIKDPYLELLGVEDLLVGNDGAGCIVSQHQIAIQSVVVRIWEVWAHSAEIRWNNKLAHPEIKLLQRLACLRCIILAHWRDEGESTGNVSHRLQLDVLRQVEHEARRIPEQVRMAGPPTGGIAATHDVVAGVWVFHFEDDQVGWSGVVGLGFEPLNCVHGVGEVLRLIGIVYLGVGEETFGQKHVLDDYLWQVEVQQKCLHADQNLRTLEHLLRQNQLCFFFRILPHHRLLLKCFHVELAIECAQNWLLKDQLWQVIICCLLAEFRVDFLLEFC